MPRRKTTTKPTAVESSELAVNEKNDQLSVFDYSQLSEPQIRKSLEIKGKMIVSGKTVSDGLLDLAQLAKEQHDNLNSYPLFIDWCKFELGYSTTMAKTFLRVGKMQGRYSDLKEAPNSLKGLDAIATAILKADSEETKQEITQAINDATEEKGKALTEKEIKELAKPYLEAEQQKIKLLEAEVRSKELTIDSLEIGKDALEAERNQLVLNLNQQEKTLANQNKQIQELNSAISAKEKELKEIADKEAKLDQEKKEFEQKVKSKADEKLAPELAEIEKQKEALKNQENQLKEELKKQKAVLAELNKEKKAFVKGSEWLQKVTNFNHLFTERALGINVVATLDDLTSLPDFNSFTEDEKEMFAIKFNSNLQIFLKNKEAWSNAVNQIELILNQMRLELNISDNKAVNVEVIDA
jgi:hypothetical protein